jgi:hypothetical protein
MGNETVPQEDRQITELVEKGHRAPSGDSYGHRPPEPLREGHRAPAYEERGGHRAPVATQVQYPAPPPMPPGYGDIGRLPSDAASATPSAPVTPDPRSDQ